MKMDLQSEDGGVCDTVDGERKTRKTRRVCVVEKLVNELQDFKNYLRMIEKSFQEVLGRIAQHMYRQTAFLYFCGQLKAVTE